MKKLFNIYILPEWFYVNKVRNQFNEQQWDAVVVENSLPLAIALADSCDAKVFFHIHNRCLNESTPNANAVLRKEMHYITVSDYIKNDLLTIKNAKSEQVSVLHNCVDSAKFDKDLYSHYRRRFRSDHGIADDDVVFLFTGRLSQVKGVHELVKAFLMLNDPKAYLCIVGSSWFGSNNQDEYVNELIELTKEHMDHILFTGFVPFDQMPLQYALADVAVIPSVGEDAAPLTVTEALASRLPVIVTDSGGIPEYVNENCAIVVKRSETLIEQLADAMRLLMHDAARRHEMGEVGRCSVLEKNPQWYYRAFEQILNDVC